MDQSFPPEAAHDIFVGNELIILFSFFKITLIHLELTRFLKDA